jgi:hypothetical protein
MGLVLPAICRDIDSEIKGWRALYLAFLHPCPPAEPSGTMTAKTALLPHTEFFLFLRFSPR